MNSSTKRKYRRRTDDERIGELQAKISDLQTKIEARKRKDSPVLKEIPKVQRRLQRFAQMALDHGRHDLANTTTAFVAGLDRIYHAGMQANKEASDDGEEVDEI